MATLKQVLVRRPWWHSPAFWIAIIVIAALAATLSARYTLWDNPTVPSLPSLRQQANPVAQPGQQVPVVEAPVAPRVIDYRVTWTEVRGSDPLTIPVEEGLYNGVNGYTNPDPEVLAYAWKILPHLEKDGNRFITVSAARSQNARDIVFVGITADNNFPSILLSVDGEKSWCKLPLLPETMWEGRPVGSAAATRVASQGEDIHLYVLDQRPGMHWWTATVKKSELPCS